MSDSEGNEFDISWLAGGSSMRVVDLVIGVGWVVFWIYWLVSAAGAKPGQGNWTRLVGLRVAIVAIVLLVLRLKLLKGHTYVTRDPVLWGIGLAVWALGLGLAIWARIYIGRNWGTPMSQKENPELVTTGPYRTIRHPIYTGLVLGMIGTAVAISIYWFVAVVVLGGYFIYSAFVEERNMTKLFPDTYPEYKRSTKMLVPFIF